MAANPESGTVERSVDEQFLDLLCADEDLLRAEFDAIITAEWPDPPSPATRREPVSRGPGPERSGTRSADPLIRPVQDRPLGREAWRRQRSPPRRDSFPTS